MASASAVTGYSGSPASVKVAHVAVVWAPLRFFTNCRKTALYNFRGDDGQFSQKVFPRVPKTNAGGNYPPTLPGANMFG